MKPVEQVRCERCMQPRPRADKGRLGPAPHDCRHGIDCLTGDCPRCAELRRLGRKFDRMFGIDDE